MPRNRTGLYRPDSPTLVSLLAILLSVFAIFMVLVSRLTTIEAGIGIIALVALGISIWQGVVQRIHAVRSVMPYINVEQIVEPSVLQFRNAGLGPAVVDKIQIGVDDGPLIDATVQNWKRVWREVGLEEYHEDPLCYVTVKHTITSPDSLRRLLWPPNDAGWTNERAVENAMRRIHVRIWYKCVYGKRYSATLPTRGGLTRGS